MELNVQTATLEVSSEICRSENSFSAESDLIVPDNMPDILNILQISANAATSACDPQTDRVLLTGNVFFNILYVADTPKREVKSINTGAMFSNIFSAQGVKDTMPVQSRVTVSGITYKLINCRKLSVHAELTGRISVSCNSEITLPTEIEGAEVKTAPITCSVIKARGEAQETVADSFDLSPAKPAVLEILRDEVKVTEQAVKVIHNKAIVKGMLGVTVLYSSESGIGQIKNEIPFTKVVNVDGLEEDMIVDCVIDVQGWETELNVGDNGGSRAIDVETMLYFNVTGRVNGGCTAITDAYFPGYELECRRSALSFSAAVQRETEDCAVKGTVKLPAASGEIETIYDINGFPRINRVFREEGDIIAEGTVTLSLLFCSENPDAPAGSYSYDMDFRQAFGGEKYAEIPRAAARLKHMNYTVGAGNSIDVRGIVSIDLEASPSCEQSVITEAKLAGRRESETPSILISYINEEKSLWEIAKKYNISRAKLMAANGITGEEELKSRRALVIPR